MKIKYLFVLVPLVLLAAACGPQMVTPTPVGTGDSTAEVATVVASPAASEVAPSAAGESITTTMSITPSGGVQIALAAIEPVEGVLATVNGQEITWADYEPELHRALYGVTQQYGVDWGQAENIALLAGFQDEILQSVMDRTLLRQLAAEEGIEVSPSDLEARVDEQKQTILDSGQYSSWEQFKEEAGLSDEYFARLVEDDALIDQVSEAHAPDREVEQVNARHILVADEETGQAVLARLNAGEDWTALAQEYSQDPSNKDNAGDLGWFPRGMMVAEFEEAAFALEPGATSDLVQTDYGFHIIQVVEKGMRELDDQTYESMLAQAFQTWLDEGRAAAETTALVQFAAEQ